MKILLIALVVSVSFNAFAEFSPRKPPTSQPPRTSYIKCNGTDPDYPRASITYNWNQDDYTVVEEYDLDVPGGAQGTSVWTGAGNVSPNEINITDGKNRSVLGEWNGSAYSVRISDGHSITEFACSTEQ